MEDQRIYVFNQYYIDFLKKLKNDAKDKKDTSKPARDILRAIKKHYLNMDKLSQDYIQTVDGLNAFWTDYEIIEDVLKMELKEEFQSSVLYQDITLQMVFDVFKDVYTLHHYLKIFNLFRTTDLPVDKVMDVLKNLMTPDFDEKIKTIESDAIIKQILSIRLLYKQRTSSVLEDELKELESTSIGKLAKEIMSDINVHELQDSLQSGNLDILSSLQNPDSGFGKLVSSVSTKMMSKLASGELQQEKLLEDALSLASKLPNMIPGMNTGDMGGLGNIGSMLQQLQKMGMNPSNLGKNMSSAQRGAASSRMRHSARKQQMSERLKKKIREKASTENNNQTDVVEDE
jgi:hypothetical protein